MIAGFWTKFNTINQKTYVEFNFNKRQWLSRCTNIPIGNMIIDKIYRALKIAAVLILKFKKKKKKND